MESQKILCDVCGVSFTMNKNLLRHVREKHQGMKRTDNEKRKKDQESTDKVRKQGHLACTDIRTCEVPVESVTHAWKDVTDKARKQGLLAGLYSETCEAQVESVPQVRSRAPWGARSGDAGLPGFPLKRRSRSKS